MLDVQISTTLLVGNDIEGKVNYTNTFIKKALSVYPDASLVIFEREESRLKLFKYLDNTDFYSIHDELEPTFRAFYNFRIKSQLELIKRIKEDNEEFPLRKTILILRNFYFRGALSGEIEENLTILLDHHKSLNVDVLLITDWLDGSNIYTHEAFTNKITLRRKLRRLDTRVTHPVAEFYGNLMNALIIGKKARVQEILSLIKKDINHQSIILKLNTNTTFLEYLECQAILKERTRAIKRDDAFRWQYIQLEFDEEAYKNDLYINYAIKLLSSAMFSKIGVLPVAKDTNYIPREIKEIISVVINLN